jgi:hypothetical protein
VTPGPDPYSIVTSDRRTLNGHTFMPSAAVPWAFTITSLSSQLVLGYGSTTASVTIQDETFGGTMDYAGIGGFLGYEYAFLDHFSVRAIINNIVFSGIDGPSALTVGSKAQFGFGAGATASMQIGESARVGILFDATASPNLALTIASGLQAIANSCQQPSGCDTDTGTIFGSTTLTILQPALAANWAPFKSLGLTANVAFQRYSSSGSSEIDGNAASFAAAADYDLGTVTSVPIGLMLQASWTTPFDATGLQHVTDLGGGIFYTGRKDLAAGMQVVSRRFAVTPGVDVSWSTYVATVGLRYFW